MDMINFAMNSNAWDQFLNYKVPKDSSWNLWSFKSNYSSDSCTKEWANSAL